MIWDNTDKLPPVRVIEIRILLINSEILIVTFIFEILPKQCARGVRGWGGCCVNVSMQKQQMSFG